MQFHNPFSNLMEGLIWGATWACLKSWKICSPTARGRFTASYSGSLHWWAQFCCCCPMDYCCNPAISLLGVRRYMTTMESKLHRGRSLSPLFGALGVVYSALGLSWWPASLSSLPTGLRGNISSVGWIAVFAGHSAPYSGDKPVLWNRLDDFTFH